MDAHSAIKGLLDPENFGLLGWNRPASFFFFLNNFRFLGSPTNTLFRYQNSWKRRLFLENLHLLVWSLTRLPLYACFFLQNVYEYGAKKYIVQRTQIFLTFFFFKFLRATCMSPWKVAQALFKLDGMTKTSKALERVKQMQFSLCHKLPMLWSHVNCIISTRQGYHKWPGHSKMGMRLLLSVS